MVRFSLPTIMEDSRRLGVVMLAAGLIGYFIEPVKSGALIAAFLGAVLVLAGSMQRAQSAAKSGTPT